MRLGVVLAVVVGVFSCVCVFICVRARINRKEKYRKMAQNAVEKLPDAKNAYLQSRLSGALSSEKQEKIPIGAYLVYIEKLLRKLTERKLSGADFLLARKLQKKIAEYSAAESVSPCEQERIPAALTSVLSLCAKYEVL